MLWVQNSARNLWLWSSVESILVGSGTSSYDGHSLWRACLHLRRQPVCTGQYKESWLNAEEKVANHRVPFCALGMRTRWMAYNLRQDQFEQCRSPNKTVAGWRKTARIRQVSSPPHLCSDKVWWWSWAERGGRVGHDGRTTYRLINTMVIICLFVGSGFVCVTTAILYWKGKSERRVDNASCADQEPDTTWEEWFNVDRSCLGIIVLDQWYFQSAIDKTILSMMLFAYV